MSADLDDLFTMLTPSASMVERALLRVTCAVPEESYSSGHIVHDSVGYISKIPRNVDDDFRGDYGIEPDEADAIDSTDDDWRGDM